ncbi:MAG: CRTAC1 family protein [Acidimicrobiia bacterium]|nr:CRTAC1 family protein [Acidimicrobiia bacterium]
MRAIAVGCAALLLAGCSREERSAGTAELFRDVAAETGLQFQHQPYPSGKFYMPEIMGAGVALLDYDNDGDLDVYLIQGMALDGGGKGEGNRLFRNELVPSGTLRFTDVTAASRTGKVMYGMGAATGDFDGDGHVDLYITGFGKNVLYRNNGDGTFSDVTEKAGVQDERWSTSAAFLDYDRDGDLDLMVLNYIDFTLRGNKACFAASGEPDYCTPKAYRPVSAKLFRNEGSGRFTDATVASGIAKAYGPGLGITCSDVNGDGWIDVYVANDTAANLLWINQRNGTFAEQGLVSGAAYSEDGLPKAGMGVSAGDFDNDGDDDMVVVNLTREGATLFQNDGRGAFQDVSLRYGVRPLTFPYTGFGVDWFDYDNDGWLDLFIANGAVTLMEEWRGQPWPFQQANTLLRNEAGRRFRDVTAGAGAAMRLKEVTRGSAFGDIDNDGGIDIVITNNRGAARLLLNRTKGRNWLRVKLEGLAAGARVGVVLEGGQEIWRRAHTDSSYLSANDPRVHFGLGRQTRVRRIRVAWPDGGKEEFAGVNSNRQLLLKRGEGKPF